MGWFYKHFLQWIFCSSGLLYHVRHIVVCARPNTPHLTSSGSSPGHFHGPRIIYGAVISVTWPFTVGRAILVLRSDQCSWPHAAVMMLCHLYFSHLFPMLPLMLIFSLLATGGGSASRPGHSLPPGKTWYPLYRRLGGPQGRSGQVWENLAPTGIRSPDRPARIQSLYWLCHPAHINFL